MQVEISLYGELQELAGVQQKVVSIGEGTRLVDLIEQLAEEFGSAFRDYIYRKEGLNVIISGKEYWVPQAMETHLQDGDKLTFLNPFFGG